MYTFSTKILLFKLKVYYESKNTVIPDSHRKSEKQKKSIRF